MAQSQGPAALANQQLIPRNLRVPLAAASNGMIRGNSRGGRPVRNLAWFGTVRPRMKVLGPGMNAIPRPTVAPGNPIDFHSAKQLHEIYHSLFVRRLA